LVLRVTRILFYYLFPAFGPEQPGAVRTFLVFWHITVLSIVLRH